MAQQPSRIPDVGGPRPEGLGDRSVGLGDPRPGEARAGLGRGPRQSAAPGTEAGRLATAPLLDALAAALPERPFRVELWDGAALPATAGDGPTFRATSPLALGHMLRAPGQLGLG